MHAKIYGIVPVACCKSLVQLPSCPWEFYYTTRELNTRLSCLQSPVYFCFVYYQYRTRIDLVNSTQASVVETSSKNGLLLFSFLTIQLIDIVEQMHRCQIIHAALKPNNILVAQLPSLPHREDMSLVLRGPRNWLQVIDFGQSIDIKLFPRQAMTMTTSNAMLRKSSFPGTPTK